MAYGEFTGQHHLGPLVADSSISNHQMHDGSLCARVSFDVRRRHPVLHRYAAAPRSLWGLAVAHLIIAVLARRVVIEERLFSTELTGCAEYAAHVWYRLIPVIW
jgi:protein-S-isoprenylcysteine O-methyltransferase Ste14